jgi:hypothetical protein
MKYTLILVLCLVGCWSGRGYLTRTVTKPDGTIAKTKIKLPSDPRDPSSIAITDDGVKVSMSGTFKPDIVAKQTTRSGMYLASMFAVGAIVLLVGRFKFPFIPLIAPVACGCASVAFFVLPTIVDRYSTEIAIAGALVLIWTAYEAWHQRRLHSANPGSAVGLAKWLKRKQEP